MIYLIVGLLLVFAYVKYLERRGIYYPVKNIECTPAIINLAFEDVYLKTQDNLKINAWFIPAEGAKYTLLFCHGNAGNIGHRLEKIGILKDVPVNIFILDYRGYGRSEGRPAEKGFYLDARAAYDYLVGARKISPDKIILYGESLGTAVAVNLAQQSPVRAIVLEGAFSCGRDMAKTIYPFLPRFLFGDSFNSLSKIKQIKAAKLFLHSKDDELIPLTLPKRLFDAAPEPKTFVQLSGGHNSGFLDSQDLYPSAIRSFINKL